VWKRRGEGEILTRYLNCKIVPFALFANKKIILYFQLERFFSSHKLLSFFNWGRFIVASTKQQNENENFVLLVFDDVPVAQVLVDVDDDDVEVPGLHRRLRLCGLGSHVSIFEGLKTNFQNLSTQIIFFEDIIKDV